MAVYEVILKVGKNNRPKSCLAHFNTSQYNEKNCSCNCHRTKASNGTSDLKPIKNRSFLKGFQIYVSCFFLGIAPLCIQTKKPWNQAKSINSDYRNNNKADNSHYQAKRSSAYLSKPINHRTNYPSILIANQGK